MKISWIKLHLPEAPNTFSKFCVSPLTKMMDVVKPQQSRNNHSCWNLLQAIFSQIQSYTIDNPYLKHFPVSTPT